MSKESVATIAVYDWRFDSKPLDILELLECVASALGVRVSRVTVRMDGQRTRSVSLSTAVEMQRTNSLPDQASSRFDVSASSRKKSFRFLQSVDLAAVKTLLCSLSAADLDLYDEGQVGGLLTDLHNRLGLTYGIGFYRCAEQDPELFAQGVGVNLESSKQDLFDSARLMAWFKERLAAADSSAPLRHLKGMIWDVFPLNVLSETHLSSRIDSTSMGDWIAHQSGHRLYSVNSNLFVWNVPAQDITRTRFQLVRSSLLIAGETEA